MSGFAWGAPEMLYLLALVPVAAILAWNAERARSAAFRAFADRETRSLLAAEVALRRRHLKTALALAACALTAVALARPACDRRPAPSKGRDVLFLIDVSRSMLAADLKPSRLEFARRGMLEFIASTRGDRVGLVAFAGSAALRCPLTTDYEFFRVAVEGVAPEAAALGGTQIAKAIRTAARDGFDDLSQRSKQIVLITDAGDHGYAAAAAAAEAARAGVRVSVIGLGDDVNGARIPVQDEGGLRYVTYRGQDVWTKLNTPAIRQIAEAGEGEALALTSDLASPGFSKVVAASAGRARRPRFEGFWIPLALAILALGAELALSDRRSA